jgi:MYXO-CTERM domain-containing protein
MARACVWLGVQLKDEGKAKQAAALYRRACDDGDAVGCNSIGFAHYTSQGARWDVMAASKAYERGCQLGDPTACSNVGELYEFGIGRAPDLEKARSFYEKGCTPVDHAGCGRIARFYEQGLGGAAVDAELAESSYRRACDADEPMPEACANLAAFLRKSGRGTASEVAQLFQRAFDVARDMSKDNPYYAYVLGTYYRDGIAVVKNPTEAAKLFVAACEGYDPVGCLAAGAMYMGASGLSANPELAVVQLDRACAANVEEACKQAEVARGGSGARKLPGPRPRGGCACDSGGDPGSLAGGLALALAVLLVSGRRSRARATQGPRPSRR